MAKKVNTKTADVKKNNAKKVNAKAASTKKVNTKTTNAKKNNATKGNTKKGNARTTSVKKAKAVHMSRSGHFLGVVVLFGIALLLMYLYIAMPRTGTTMGSIRNVLIGLGGSVAFMIPILFVWVGHLMLCVAREKRISLWYTVLDGLLFLCLFTAVQVCSAEAVIRAAVQNNGYFMKGYVNFIDKSYRFGGGGGALGALMGWPLYNNLGKWGGLIATIILALLSLIATGRAVRYWDWMSLHITQFCGAMHGHYESFMEARALRAQAADEAYIEALMMDDADDTEHTNEEKAGGILGIFRRKKKKASDLEWLLEEEEWQMEAKKPRSSAGTNARAKSQRPAPANGARRPSEKNNPNRRPTTATPAKPRRKMYRETVLLNDFDSDQAFKRDFEASAINGQRKLAEDEFSISREKQQKNRNAATGKTKKRPASGDEFDVSRDPRKSGDDEFSITRSQQRKPGGTSSANRSQPRRPVEDEFSVSRNRPRRPGETPRRRLPSENLDQTEHPMERRPPKPASNHESPAAEAPQKPKGQAQGIGVQKFSDFVEELSSKEAPKTTLKDMFATPQPQTSENSDDFRIEPEPLDMLQDDVIELQKPMPKLKRMAAPKVEEAVYNYPPIDLLVEGEAYDASANRQGDMEKAHLLEQTLREYGIESKLTGIAHGPAVTRFELQPAPGVKVSRITSLADDIAMHLAAMSVRIEAPIPGKAAVGVEIPNEKVETVHLRDVLESAEARKNTSKIAVGLGKDNSGRYIVADIAKMPHVLIAGQTGSGKSVCINSIITSILFRATPDEVRMILIDPKVVELSIYNDIPHLICPVVTDPKKAAGALDWAVAEMSSRYKKFAERGVRDIKGYNKSLAPDEKIMPQMVIIIDELADLMMVAPGEVEDSICRLAQLARAAGMHLVIATQRPSVNVITGIIKANIPTRIAFSVASQVDSRTMIDHGGAEKLLGNGDMLFVPSGINKQMRVQGAWVSDEEVHAVVSYIHERSETSYDVDMIEQMENSTRTDAEKEEIASEYDPRLPEAVEIVLEAGQASVSMLQRRMRVGYARAGRLIDEMQLRGIVSEADGAKPRTVLITREEFDQMFEEE